LVYYISLRDDEHSGVPHEDTERGQVDLSQQLHPSLRDLFLI
jgi:hypothetical protein